MEDSPERRKNGGLTDEQVEAVKQAILDSIYQEIGKSLVRKAVWAIGAIILAAAAWLHGSGFLKLPPGSAE